MADRLHDAAAHAARLWLCDTPEGQAAPLRHVHLAAAEARDTCDLRAESA